MAADDDDDDKDDAPRIRPIGSGSQSASAAPAVRLGSPVRSPHSVRSSAMGPPSVAVLESQATPSLLSLAQSPTSTSQHSGGSLLFVCVDCWRTFSDGARATCACERPRPASGWAAMPYLFRKRYLFVDLLGRGGMGAVFRAYDQAAGNASGETPWVAVKVVQKGTPEVTKLLKEMFQKEVAAAQMLAQHKQFFVPVLGHDGVDPAYLVSEHVSWPTLEEMLTSQTKSSERLPPVQVARIGTSILRGVAKMHFHRIVHRDLTPANIFIQRAADDADGYDVKITDLGIWAFDAMQSDSESLTLVGKLPTIEGTPAYMSPEQARGDPVGAVSDLHTIGSLLWELATGSVPFPVESDDLPPHELVERRFKLLKSAPKRPDGMPEGLYKVLAKAVAFRPEKRWPSAIEMRKALDAFVKQYQATRQRDMDASLKSVRELHEQVTAMREKLLPMRGLLERLGTVAVVLRDAKDHGAEAEPEALRAIAGTTGAQLETIRAELIAIAVYLETVKAQGEKKADDASPDGAPSAARSRKTVTPFAAVQQSGKERSLMMPFVIVAGLVVFLLIGYLLGRPRGGSPEAAASAAPVASSAPPLVTAAPASTPAPTASEASSADAPKKKKPRTGAPTPAKPTSGDRELIDKNPYD